ncbi:MAG TPA: hypothetical protein PK644_10365 [bacterium]|nr:hypothetical protein [bacterium]
MKKSGLVLTVGFVLWSRTVLAQILPSLPQFQSSRQPVFDLPEKLAPGVFGQFLQAEMRIFPYTEEAQVKDSPPESFSSSRAIVAYDSSPSHHKGEGRNVLFLDVYVAFVAEKEFQVLLEENQKALSR